MRKISGYLAQTTQSSLPNLSPINKKLLDYKDIVAYTSIMIFSYNPQKSLGYLSGLTSRLLNQLLATRFKEAGIDMTAEQWGAVVVLLQDEGITQRQLAERLYLEKSSVSRLIDGMELRGWIVRKKDPRDSRSRLLYPTEQVKVTAEQCATIAGNTLAEAQQGISEDELALMHSLLHKVIANLRE